MSSRPDSPFVDDSMSSEELGLSPEDRDPPENPNFRSSPVSFGVDPPDMRWLHRQLEKDSEVPSHDGKVEVPGEFAGDDFGLDEPDIESPIDEDSKSSETEVEDVHSSMGSEDMSILSSTMEPAEEVPDIESQQVPTEPEVHVGECCICLTELTTNDAIIDCNGSDAQHSMHSQCFLKYIRASCAPGGAFDGERLLGGDEQSNTRSESGQLPCPHFTTDTRCDCGSISDEKIFGALARSAEVARLYKLAVERVAYRTAEMELNTRINNGQQPENNDPVRTRGNQVPGGNARVADTTDQIRRAVERALDEGLYIKCPNCDRAGIKDGACMHITCGTTRCGTQYCYCCGRQRGTSVPDHLKCRGCDARHIYIEQHDGWGNFSMNGETPGYGALHEFHRRRMAYFVRRVKEETNHRRWEEFKQENPDILTHVPTMGRAILWQDLDTATAPVFGNSTEDDLLWKLPPRVADQTENQPFVPDVPNNDDDDEIPNVGNGGGNGPLQLAGPPSLQDTLKSERGRQWLFLGVMATVLLVAGGVTDSSWLVAIGSLLLTLFLFFGIAHFLLWVPDYCATHQQGNWVRQINEALFFGRREEVIPLLSSGGRWATTSKTIIWMWVGGIAIGSWFLAVSERLGGFEVASIAIGRILITASTLNFAFVTLSVNRDPLPPRDNRDDNDAYTWFMFTINAFVLSLALGVGLRGAESDKAFKSGLFFLAVGIAGLAAETIPRLTGRNFDEFWSWPVDQTRHLQLQLSTFGITVGSMMIHIGLYFDNTICWALGIPVLIAGILTALLCSCSNCN